MSVKRTGRLQVLIPILLLPLLSYAWPRVARATEALSGYDVDVPDGVISGDLVTAARTVLVEADIDGDLAAAGASVTVEGPVEGYVMSAGRRVTLDGRIGNDLWAAGETVDVDSSIGNNAMVVGRTVHLHPGTVIGHDAHLAGNTVTAEGRIERNLTIGAAAAHIGGHVGGAVEAQAGRVTVLPGAVIQGDLVVRAPQPPEIAPDTKVIGQVRYDPLEERGGWLTWPLLWLVCFAALLLLGLAAMAFSPAWAGRVAGTLRARLGMSILTGFVVLVLVPIAIGVLALTVVGIPLALVLLALYVVLLMLSGVFVSYRVGEWLVARAHPTHASRWARIVLGALVISLGMTLPIVGWIIALAVLITGAGALALERRDLRAQLRGSGLV